MTKPPVASPATDRRQQIDALRALGIFCVLFDHFTGFHAAVRPGDLGVRLFLMVSGYLITRIMLRGREATEREGRSRRIVLRDFYIRRALRIWPAYLAVIVGVWISNIEGARAFIHWHALFLTNILFALRNEWGPPWMLAHLWTLSVQEQFYAFWPLVLLLVPRTALFPILGLGIIAAIAFRGYMVAIGTPYAVSAYVIPLASFDALSVGAGLAIIEARGGVGRWMKPRLLVVLVSALLIFWLNWTFRETQWLFYAVAPSLWLLPLGLLLAGAVHGYSGLAGALLSNPVLRYLGRISLGIYLYHLPLWGLIMAAGFRWGFYHFPAGPWALLVLTPLTVGLAAISWQILEQPINRLKSRFPYGRGATPKVEVQLA